MITREGGYIIRHATDQASNILLPAESAKRAVCSICYNVMKLFDDYYVCLSCGNKVKPADLMPDSKLTAKSDGGTLLVQPAKGSKTNDIPEGCTLINDEEIPQA
jgi:hypothetical protein